MYLIKRKRDGRPIAGIFAPIKTEEMARAVLARWRSKYNWPDDQFTIEPRPHALRYTRVYAHGASAHRIKRMYLIKRKRDGRPIAGIFAPIKTEEMARAVLARWQYNWPDDQFTIEDARGAQGAGRST
jgi:hypothetical protein